MGVIKLRYPVKSGVFQNDQDILTLFNYIYSKLEINSEEIKECKGVFFHQGFFAQSIFRSK